MNGIPKSFQLKDCTSVSDFWRGSSFTFFVPCLILGDNMYVCDGGWYDGGGSLLCKFGSWKQLVSGNIFVALLNQEMMGGKGKEAQNHVTTTWSITLYPHNIVNTGPLTLELHRPLAIC